MTIPFTYQLIPPFTDGWVRLASTAVLGDFGSHGNDGALAYSSIPFTVIFYPSEILFVPTEIIIYRSDFEFHPNEISLDQSEITFGPSEIFFYQIEKNICSR